MTSYYVALVGLFIGLAIITVATNLNLPVMVAYALYAGYWYSKVRQGKVL